MSEYSKTKEELISELNDLKQKYEVLERKYTSEIVCRDYEDKASFAEKAEVLQNNELTQYTEKSYQPASLYKALFERSHSVKLLIDPETGKIIDANEKACEFYGWTHAELCKKNISQLNALSEAKVNTGIDKALNGDQNHFTFKHRISNGELREVEVYVSPIPYGMKTILYALVHDVSKQKRLEFDLTERLKELNCHNQISRLMSDSTFSVKEVFEQIVHLIPDAWQFPEITEAFIQISQGTYQTANFKAARHKLHQDIKVDGIVDGFIEVCLPDDKLPDTDQLFLPEESNLLFSIAERIGNFIEKIQSNKVLTESEEKYAKAFQTSPYAISIARVYDGKFIDVNDAFVEITGYSREEILGDIKSLDFWYNLEDRNELYLMLKEQKKVSGKEYQFKNRSGEILTGIVAAQLIDFKNESFILSSINDVTAIKKTEFARQESENLYKAIINASPDSINIADLNGTLLFASPRTLEMYGYENFDQVRHHSLNDFIVPEERELVQSDIIKMHQGIFKGAACYKAVKADGTIFDIEVNAEFIKDENGTPTKMILINRDVTERKQTERALLESEAKFRSIFENMLDCYYEASLDGILLEVSPAIEILTKGQYSRLELIGKSFVELYADKGAREEFYSNIMKSGKVIDYELSLLNKDGSIVPCAISSVISYDEKGIPVKITGILRDITERKVAEEKLHKISQAVEQSPVSIVITNLKGDIEYANPKACETTGYAFEELKGQNPRVLKSGETPTNEYEFLWDSISHGNVWRGIFHNKRKNGELYWESSQITPVTDNNGNITNYLAIKEDITERKKIQEELLNSETRFREISEQSQNVIWETNSEAVYTFVSPASEIAWGLKPSDLIGKKHFFDIHPEEGRKEFIDTCLNQIQRGEQFRNMESPIQGGDGKINWVLTNGMPYLDSNGNVKGYRGSSLNINLQKQTFRDLKESEERYKSIFKDSKSIMLVVDAENGNIVDANEKAAAFYGWSLEEFRKKKLSDIDVISESEASAKMQEIISGSQKELLLKHRLADGTIRDVEVFAGPISFGKKKHLFGIIHDVTDRRLAEQAVLQREKDLNYSQQIAHMGSWQLNMSTNTSIWSDNMFRLFELDPEKDEASQELFFDLIHPDDRHLIDEYMGKIIHDRKQVTFEMRINLKSGKTIWVQNSMVPGFEGDNLVTLNGTNVDITEKKKSVADLLQREKELNQAQEIAGMGSWSLNLLTSEMTWSENYFNLAGIPLGTEVKAETFLERVHPDDLHLVDENHEKMLWSKKPVQYFIRVRFKKDKYHWIQNNVYPFFENDKMVLLRGAYIDITDKKIAEDRIKSQNETLNAIIKAMPDLMFVIDKEGKYLEVFANESEKLLISPEKIIGSSIDQTFSKELTEVFLGKIHESISKNRAVTVDYTISLANSPSTDFEARIVPIDQEKVLILARDVTEKAIRENELKRLSTAVQQSPVITVITDLHANIEYVNPAFTNITGYSQEEVIGKNVRILQSGKTDKAIYKQLWETIKTGKEWHGEWINKKKNGEQYWEDVLITPIHDDAGIATNYLAVKQDITKRKQSEQVIFDLNYNLERKIEERTAELAKTNEYLLEEISERKRVEDALSKSEKNYRTVVENVNEVIFQTDAGGLWVFLNKSWEEVTGFSIAESLGQLFVNFVHPDDRSRNWEIFEPLIKREKDYCRHEIRYLTKNGGFRWIEVFARLGINENDEITGTFGTLMDITERKQAEDSLQQLSTRLTLALRAGGFGVWDYDLTKNTFYWDNQMLELYGIKEVDFNGSYDAWQKGLQPDDKIRVDQEFQKAIHGEKEFDTEFRVIWPDGSVHYLKALAAVQRDDSGKALHIIGTNWDISVQKRAADFEREMLLLSPTLTGLSLNKINDAIHQALSRIGEFLSADRSYIFEFAASGSTMNNTYEWCNKGINPEIENLQDIPCEIFPRWMEMLRNNENIVITSVKDIPESWQAEREILEPQGIQSLIIMPMLAEDTLIGFVGLDSVIEKKDYNNSEINILKVWSSMLASLINNQRSEKLLEQTRQNYKTFFNTIDDFLFIFDDRGNIIDSNNNVNVRLGYTNAELKNKSVLMLRPPERRDEALSVMHDILNGKAQYCSIPLITKSGEPIPVETKTKRGIWNGQSVIFSVSKDITQIKLSEEKFSAAFQLNSAMMAISDFKEGKLLDVNQAFINASGYQKEEIIGRTITELGILQGQIRQNVVNEIEKGLIIKEFETSYFTKNNEQRTGILSSNSIFIGGQHCLLTVTIDITDRKRSEEKLKIAQAEAEKANLAKSEFLSRMSHELRTPMNSILGFAQLLDLSELNLAQSKGVKHILKSGNHLLNLINEVLDIARIESGRIALSIEPVQLSGVISEVLDIIQPIANQYKISIEFTRSQDNLKSVMVDKQRFKQVILNLLNNAIKYNRKDGSVVIKTVYLGDVIRILVVDTGLGISAENISKIFIPFERIGAEKSSAEGTGLGLAVVKKLMEAMGGKIGVESVLNEGTTFWIEFPVSKNQNKLNDNNNIKLVSEAIQNNLKGLILYIEDNSSNVELVEQILSKQLPGIRLMSEMNGNRGVNVATEYKPDLILLDLDLPDIHGSEVLRLLQNNPIAKSIPVVIISADAMSHQQSKLLKMGAKNYLTKPLNVVGFVEVIEFWLGKKGLATNTDI